MSTLGHWKSNNKCIGHSIIAEHGSYFHRTVWKSFNRNVYLTNVQNMKLLIVYSQILIFSSITVCMYLLPVVIVFVKLLIIPEIAIILNQISSRIAYKSIAYKRHVMLFWRNKFLLWVFCVFVLYFIWTIFPNKYFQK